MLPPYSVHLRTFPGTSQLSELTIGVALAFLEVSVEGGLVVDAGSEAGSGGDFRDLDFLEAETREDEDCTGLGDGVCRFRTNLQEAFDKLFTFARRSLNVLPVLAVVGFIKKNSIRGAVMNEGAIVKAVALPGSEGEHELQEKYETALRAQAFYRHQVLGYLNSLMQAFVTKQEMMFVGTADKHGEADTSFRAGLPGFVCVLDEKTLAYPEYRGNGVMSSLGNISENPHVGLLFVDFTEKIGLHVNGRARIVENDEFLRDTAACEPVREDIPAGTGRAPERWVVVSVVEAYIHCAKHIPRMRKIDEEILWGTDDVRAKGGDYFRAKTSPRTK
jgi:predicted pyridoxine 5'-phosphate oxidase superfamily flavin-nucleotide-binding protein